MNRTPTIKRQKGVPERTREKLIRYGLGKSLRSKPTPSAVNSRKRGKPPIQFNRMRKKGKTHRLDWLRQLITLKKVRKKILRALS